MSSDLTSIESQFNINSVKPNDVELYEFENFRLDTANLMLYENETAILLAPKVVETILALIENAGEIVSKERMMNRLWKNSFVADSNLTQNIYLLRKTLGKGSDGRDLIETLRRRGYRFTGHLKNAATDGLQNSVSPEVSTAAKFDLNSPEKYEKPDVFDSIAVLPFKNESKDEAAEYLSEGITESIINRLSQVEDFRVVARTTAFRYKNSNTEPVEIGRELNVSAILSGRILQFGEKLIVRTELVDTANGWQIWGEQFNRRDSDVLELQETIAREISENLQLQLTGEETKRLSKRYTENTKAYHLYIKGRFFLNKRLTETTARAAEYFQKAIDIDPAFAPAYVGLADCFPLLSLYGALTPHEAYPKARAAAEKALEIDDQYTKAYNSLGVIKLFYEWDWTGAEKAFRQAIKLNPGYPDAHLRYGMFLTAVGRFDESITEFRRARDLDPMSLITKTISGYPFYYSRQYEFAEDCFREVIAMEAGYSMAHFRLGLTYAQQKKLAEAVAEIETSASISNDRDSIAALGYVKGLQGDSGFAKNTLAELNARENKGFVSAYVKALVFAGMNDAENALGFLEKAYDERSYWLIYLQSDPVFDFLRSDSRFVNLLEKIFGVHITNAELFIKTDISDQNAESVEDRIKSKSEPFQNQNRNLYLAFIAGSLILLFIIIYFFLNS